MRWFNRTIVTAVVLLLTIVAVITAAVITGESPVQEILIELKAEVSAENWTEAHESLQAVRTSWETSRPYTSFTNSTQDVQSFEEGIAQVEAYILTQSKTDAAAEVARLHQIWKQFER